MYSVRYNCSNCGHSFLKSYPKGTIANYKVVCENCGCLTAHKSWNQNVWQIGRYVPRYVEPLQPWPYYYTPWPESSSYVPWPYPETTGDYWIICDNQTSTCNSMVETIP
jgi:DNA-directed RNA polymerase subunit RPC12/RpoP